MPGWKEWANSAKKLVSVQGDAGQKITRRSPEGVTKQGKPAEDARAEIESMTRTVLLPSPEAAS